MPGGWVLCGMLALAGCGGGGGGGGSSAMTWPATGKTKVDAYGQPLAANAPGWSCVRDNETGLMWEVKNISDVNHLHYVGKAYTNYTSYEDSPVDPDAASNSVGFLHMVNAQGLCGAGGWRMPTKDELAGLLTGRTDLGLYGGIYIDPAFFPDVGHFNGVGRPVGLFWSSTPYLRGSAWGVDFGNNIIFTGDPSRANAIRLVRDS